MIFNYHSTSGPQLSVSSGKCLPSDIRLSHWLNKEVRGKRICEQCQETEPLREILGLEGDWDHSQLVACITWKQIHWSRRVTCSICNAFKVFDNCLFVHQDNTCWTLYMLFCLFLGWVPCYNTDFYLKNVIKLLCSSVHRSSFLCSHTNTLYNKFVVRKLKRKQGHFQACYSIWSEHCAEFVLQGVCWGSVIFCQMGHSVTKAWAF